METKICNKCKEEKELNQFYKRSDSTDGYRNDCKACKDVSLREKIKMKGTKSCTTCKEEKKLDEFYEKSGICKVCKKTYAKTYREINKEDITEYKKNYNIINKDRISDKKANYYFSNKEKILANVKEYYINNKEDNLGYHKDYYEKNKDIILQKCKEYRKVNYEKIKIRKNKYYLKNKKETIEKAIKYRKNRKLIDPLYKLKITIRSLTYNALKNGGFKKSQRTITILGCDFDFFKQYIENRFETWMTWENHGKYNGDFNYGWDLDHIIPLNSANTEEEIIKLSHYTNLQPLCSKINRDIKRANII